MRLQALSKFKFLVFALVLAPGFAVTSCDGGDGDGDGDCGDAGAPSFQSIDWSSCTHCHSSSKSGADRQSAPSDLNYDDYASAKDHAAQTGDRVGNDSMPPPGSDAPALTDEAKAQIIDWANCGAPE